MTLFKQSKPGQRAYSLPKSDSAFEAFHPASSLCRKNAAPLPEVSELQIMRHFTALARKNVGIDNLFYPLGSCTMKYNPRVNEQCARLPPFARSHPLADDTTVQGNLALIDTLITMLCRLCGMTAGTLTPNAGAQGELCGIKMIHAYHRSRGDDTRNEILIPDDAHGTNPATAAMAGFVPVSIPTARGGDIDLAAIQAATSERTAGLMLTNPNTLGLFSPRILEISSIIHGNGGLLYYDGANLNAILNVCRPGDMGFDVMHLNLHKTFSTPHGGGGPGSGPVLCNDTLAPFLPLPYVKREDDSYRTYHSSPTSIGLLTTFYGNFGIYLRAYTYILLHGDSGLRRVAEAAVLNANYLKQKLAPLFTIPYPQTCMHEFVIQADNYLDQGINAYHIAKRLLDYGVHSPTVYFPLIVKECMLIEPTETESLETLEHFVSAMAAIVTEITNTPDLVKEAPHTQAVKRLDEVRAAKNPILRTY